MMINNQVRLLETRSKARQIADEYVRLIKTGRVRDGEELPGRTELAFTWGVGTGTAQHALEILRNEGWSRTYQGGRSVAVLKHAVPREAC